MGQAKRVFVIYSSPDVEPRGILHYILDVRASYRVLSSNCLIKELRRVQISRGYFSALLYSSIEEIRTGIVTANINEERWPHIIDGGLTKDADVHLCGWRCVGDNWTSRINGNIDVPPELPLLRILRGVELSFGYKGVGLCEGKRTLGGGGHGASDGYGRQCVALGASQKGQLIVHQVGLPRHFLPLRKGNDAGHDRAASEHAGPEHQGPREARQFDFGRIGGIGCLGGGITTMWWASSPFIYWRRRRLAVMVSSGALCLAAALIVAGAALIVGSMI